MYCFRPNILFKNWLYCSIYCSCTVQIFGLVGVSVKAQNKVVAQETPDLEQLGQAQYLIGLNCIFIFRGIPRIFIKNDSTI